MKSSGGDPIVVIGGGILGSSIALHVSDLGADVVLVDRDPDPAGASVHSFASLSALEERNRELYLLKCLGMSEWRRWSKRLGEDVELTWDGQLRWSNDAWGGERLLDQVKLARSRGYPVRLITEDDLRSRLPSADPGRVAAAALAPDDGSVNPLRAIKAARAVLGSGGAKVMLGSEARLDASSDFLVVDVGGDVVRASAVVMAAGAGIAAFADHLGLDISLRNSPGMLAVTTPARPLLRGSVQILPESGPDIHLRQLVAGTILIGEGNQETVVRDPSTYHGRRLLRQATRYFPGLREVDLQAVTIDWRPMPGDRAPIVGALPGLPGLYGAIMHSGVTLAPVVGRLLASEIVCGQRSSWLEPFRPSRFRQREIAALLEVERIFTGEGDRFTAT